MRKVGKANLEKARGFQREQNWVQTLRYAEIAATKLKQLKDRRLETVQDINGALVCKYNALQFMDRHMEALECAEERYTLWAINHLRNSGSMLAAMQLIQSCLHNNKYEDAERYARHAMFMINDMTDNFIPVNERDHANADVSYYLAKAILALAKADVIPPEQKQKAGEEAIALLRKALELHTQLRGTEDSDALAVDMGTDVLNSHIAGDMGTLAEVLDFFNNVDDNEIFRLLDQAIAIYRRVEGNLSVNVAAFENKFGNVYGNRADRAEAAKDLDRCLANLKLSLPHYQEAARIHRANNHVHRIDGVLRNIAATEEEIQEIEMAREAAATAAAAPVTKG